MLLNLHEDHLDRHGTFENYRAAKLAVFAHQPPGTLAVVPGRAWRSTTRAARRRASRSARRRAATPSAAHARRTSRTATARCSGAASR